MVQEVLRSARFPEGMDDDALSGNDKLSAFGDQLKNTMAPPALSTWAQVSSAADRILEQMNKGQVTVDEG